MKKEDIALPVDGAGPPLTVSCGHSDFLGGWSKPRDHLAKSPNDLPQCG